MSDDALREVLRSPLDDEPPSRRRGWRGPAAVLLAAAAGFALVAGWQALAGHEGRAVETSTTTAPPSTTVPGPAVLAGLEARTVVAWEQDDRVFLVVTATALPGSDPAELAPLPGAHWVLRLAGGQLVTATAELTQALAPSVFTLVFPRADLSAGAELLAYPLAQTIEADFPTTLASTRFPWEGPAQGTPFRLGGEEVGIDRIRLDDAGGELVWHLAGDTTARAVVDAAATYTEPEAGPQALVSEVALPYAFDVSAATVPPATRSGTLRLYHLNSIATPSYYASRFYGDRDRAVAVADLHLGITVRLYLYATEPAVVPVTVTVAPPG